VRDFIYNIFVKYLLPKHILSVGEYIEDMAGAKYKIEGLYYSLSLRPILIVKSSGGEYRSFPEAVVDRVS